MALAPEIVTFALSILTVSNRLLLLRRFTKILPTPFCIFSFNVITRLLPTLTAVAPLTGERLTRVGAITSVLVNCHVLLPVKPIYALFAISLIAPLAIST